MSSSEAWPSSEVQWRARSLSSGERRARTVGTSASATCSLARRLIDENERLASLLDHRSHQAGDGLARRRYLPGREVGEGDSPVRIDSQVEGDRSEVARHMTGPEPVGDLPRVPDGRGERHDLEVGVLPPEPGQADLEGRSPLGIPEQVDFVRHDHAQPVEPRAPASKEPVGLLTRRDEHVEAVELLGRKVEVAGRKSDLETELRESLQLLGLLLGQRPERDEVKSGAMRPGRAEQGEVGDERLPARGRAGEQEALAGHERVERRDLRREQGLDPVRLQHPAQVGVDRKLGEADRGRRFSTGTLRRDRSARAARHGRPSGPSY